MRGPRSGSRKGLFLRVSMIWHNIGRDWHPHRGRWQPDAQTREVTRRTIAEMRAALDVLEAALGPRR